MSRLPRALALLTAVLIAGCSESAPPAPAPAPTPKAPLFTDVTEAAGLSFTHDADARGEYRLPEGIGSGGALFDADGDDDLDLYLVQGGPLASPGAEPKTNRLFLNDGAGRFREGTQASGTGVGGYGIGCAAADYDADGDVDLYVTRIGPNVLLRNDGGATFTDVTEHAGVGDPGFGASAAFLDYDRDGVLDLYVTNYVDWSPSAEGACYDPSGIRDYCGPLEYESPSSDRLYRGQGEGRFEDVTGPAGIAASPGNGLGVLCTDFDGDGWVDVFVANDQTPGFLWVNGGDGTFVEDGMMRGCAFNADGIVIAGMGVASEDLDGDGDFDVVVTNIRDQPHLALRNDGDRFTDVSHEWGFGGWAVPYTGFGIALLDADHDGTWEGVVANGAVNRNAEPLRDDNPFAEPNQLLVRDAEGRFGAAGDAAGAVWNTAHMSRGLLTGDVDGDGDLDLVVTNNRGPAQLLRNETGRDLAWTRLDLVPAGGARHALNARVRIHADGRVQLRELRPHAGYLGTHEAVVHAGLGGATGIDSVTVGWPSGALEVWRDLPARVTLRLREGDAPSFESVPPSPARS